MTTAATGTSAASSSTNGQAPALLRISPKTFQFTASKVSSGLVSKLKIKNLLQNHVGYKFKTNAPLRYSVKPVLGVLAPGQSIEVFVRCESWVNPQDRFLLQSVALGEEESQQIDAVSWKEIDRRRIIEDFIQCSSSSTLSMRDPQDDGGSLSSSSSNTSSTSSVVSSTLSSSAQSERARQQRAYHQQIGHKPLVVAHVHAAGRKMSTSSSTSSTTSSPGSYPTLFSSKGAPARLSPTSMQTKEKSGAPGAPVASLVSVPLGYLRAKFITSNQTIRTVSRFLAVRQYTKMQVFTVSVICLLLGLLMPLEKIFLLVRGGSTGTSSTMGSSNSGTQFRSGAMEHQQKAQIFAASPSTMEGLPILVTSSPQNVGSTEMPKLNKVVLEQPSAPQEMWQEQDEIVAPVAEVEGAL